MGSAFLAFSLLCAVPSGAARVTREASAASLGRESQAVTVQAGSLGCCCRDLGMLDDVREREEMCGAQQLSARIAFPGAIGRLQGEAHCCVQAETCSGIGARVWKSAEFCQRSLPDEDVNLVLACCCQDVTSMPDPEDRAAVCEARINSARIMFPTATGRLQGGRACCVQSEQCVNKEEVGVDQWCFQSLENVMESMVWEEREKNAEEKHALSSPSSSVELDLGSDDFMVEIKQSISDKWKRAQTMLRPQLAGGLFGTRKAVWQMLTGVSPYMTTPPEALHLEEMSDSQKQLYEKIRFHHKAVWARNLESYGPLKTATTIAAVATLGITELVKTYALELGDPEHWWFIMQGQHEDHTGADDPKYYFVAQFGTGNVGVPTGNQSAAAQLVTSTLALSFTGALVMGQYSARGVRELHPWIHFPIQMYGTEPKERSWGHKKGWEKVTRRGGYTVRELEYMVKVSPSSTKWNDGKYHLLYNNCQHFAKEMFYNIVV